MHWNQIALWLVIWEVLKHLWKMLFSPRKKWFLFTVWCTYSVMLPTKFHPRINYSSNSHLFWPRLKSRPAHSELKSINFFKICCGKCSQKFLWFPNIENCKSSLNLVHKRSLQYFEDSKLSRILKCGDKLSQKSNF